MTPEQQSWIDAMAFIKSASNSDFEGLHVVIDHCDDMRTLLWHVAVQIGVLLPHVPDDVFKGAGNAAAAAIASPPRVPDRLGDDIE